MDTLRRLADIPDERFITYPQQGTGWVTYMHARNLSSNLFPAFIERGFDESDMMGELDHLEGEISSDSDVRSSLTLLSVGRDRDERILILKERFMETFHRFAIDKRFLQLVNTNRYGLHYDWEGPRVSYYIGTALYTLMWSFDKWTCTTRAILLSRDNMGTEELSSLRQLIGEEKQRLYSPFLLAWASLVHLSNWMDSSTYYLLTTMRQLEELTGYGPYGGKKSGNEIPVEKLTQASKDIGSVQVNLANQLRHVAIGTAISSHLATRLDELASYSVQTNAWACRGDVEAFGSTVSSLQRSLDDSTAYANYLQERARSQNTVVYALMSQADTRININLARASKELAEAAKRDASSMKTIAIVTMLFLPGTYFASLWAIPSLKWGEPNVIQPDFYWYWVFTVPSTLLVFAVWFGRHKWYFVSLPEKLRFRRRGSKYEALGGLSPSPVAATTAGYYGEPSLQPQPPAFVAMPGVYYGEPTALSAPPMMQARNQYGPGAPISPVTP